MPALVLVLLWLCCISLSVSTISCKVKDAKSKFVALAHSKDDYYSLIHKVDKRAHPSWKVGYTFIDQKSECASDDFKISPYKKQLENNMKQVFQLWLSPLIDKKNIISSDDIHFDLLVATDVLKEQFEKDFIERFIYSRYVNDGVLASYDLLIFFQCNFVGKDGIVLFGGDTPVMTLRPKSKYYKAFLTEKKMFPAEVFVHEVGHTFGLDDAYAHNRGYQAESVMKDQRNAFDGESLVITADDRAGIRWLYRYHVEKSLKKEDCGDEYIYHNDTCIPKYPVINRVKSGKLEEFDLQKLSRGLHSMIDEQDELGNTPLHYAVMRANRHGTYDMCELLLANGADTTIKNSEGKTAKDLAEADNTCFSH